MMCKDGSIKTKLSSCSLGFAFGVAEGLFLMLFAWSGLMFEYGISHIQSLAEIFPGYAPSVVGGLWGLLWGFIEGFIFGFVVGIFYNFSFCCCKKFCSSEHEDKK